MMGSEELRKRFGYHPPSDQKARRHQEVREAAESFARRIDGLVPDGREKSLAITATEEAMMWANKALAQEGN